MRNQLEKSPERHRLKRCGLWADNVFYDHTNLHIFISDTMSAEIYSYEVLESHIKFFRGTIHNNIVIIDGNTRSHRDALVKEYLERI